ncbi:hypothetical protein GCM10007977_025150 [Dactylosporangium sucinum]|uniref:Sigma-70 family RNA polymerase sigma factor n=2 Tax=Dactylosporangium sucinum TaxID=1424081 RepID=A0A917WRB4_9ACTN|nr:hypothetical protein GCM10007977_025150 [Dactylosporangium sucinum]
MDNVTGPDAASKGGGLPEQEHADPADHGTTDDSARSGQRSSGVARVNDAIGRQVDAVYRQHRSQLLALARKLAYRYQLADAHHDAEDAVQEAFAEALMFARIRNMTGSFPDAIHNPAAWMVTIVRRRAARAARAAHHGMTVTTPDPDDSGARWSSIAESATAEQRHSVNEVLAAIALLPRRRRLITYLRHVEGWSEAEVADLLQCAPGTISAAASAGRRAVRQRVGSVATVHYRRIDTRPYLVLVALGVLWVVGACLGRSSSPTFATIGLWIEIGATIGVWLLWAHNSSLAMLRRFRALWPALRTLRRLRQATRARHSQVGTGQRPERSGSS